MRIINKTKSLIDMRASNNTDGLMAGWYKYDIAMTWILIKPMLTMY